MDESPPPNEIATAQREMAFVPYLDVGGGDGGGALHLGGEGEAADGEQPRRPWVALALHGTIGESDQKRIPAQNPAREKSPRITRSYGQLALGEVAIYVVEREVGDAGVHVQLAVVPHLGAPIKNTPDQIKKTGERTSKNPPKETNPRGERVPDTLEMNPAASRRAAEAAAETDGEWWPSASRRLAIGSSAGLVNGFSRSNSYSYASTTTTSFAPVAMSMAAARAAARRRVVRGRPRNTPRNQPRVVRGFMGERERRRRRRRKPPLLLRSATTSTSLCLVGRWLLIGRGRGQWYKRCRFGVLFVKIGRKRKRGGKSSLRGWGPPVSGTQ